MTTPLATEPLTVEPAATPGIFDDGGTGHSTTLGTRISIVYFAYFFFLGINTPFVATWLAARDLDPTWIAAIGSASLISRTLGQPVMSYLADVFGRRLLLLISGVGAAAATLILVFCYAPGAILAAVFVAGIFIGPVIPLADALSLADKGINYGRVRLWGSLGFAMANVMGGALIDRFEAPMVIWLEVAGLVILAFAAKGLPNSSAAARAIIDPQLAADRNRALLAVFRSWKIWLFILAVATVNAGHAYFYLFSANLWSETLGFTKLESGLLWAWGVLAEVGVLFLFGNRVTPRWAKGLLLAGAVGAAVRWTGTAYAGTFLTLLVLQTLHGLTYGATHLGAMQVMRAAVPEHISTAVMGVYAGVVNGVIIGIVMANLGWVYETMQGRGFLWMAVLGVIGTVGMIVFTRVWHGGLFDERAAPPAR